MSVIHQPKKIHSKSELFLAYSKIKMREKRTLINEIIAEVRGVSIKVAGYQNNLRPKEVRLFKERIDENYF